MAVTKKYGGLLQTIDSSNPQIDLAPSEKAVADYVDDSFESPTTLTINGPSSIDTSGGAGEADYQILPTPSGAYGYKNVQVTCTDTKVTISDITKFGFHIAVAGFTSSADIVLNLSATKNDGTTITATKTVNVAVPFLGVGIKHTNGNIYTAAQWSAEGFTADKAQGVVIVDSVRGIMISNTIGTSMKWCVPGGTVLSGVTTTTVEAEANVDFAGAENTDAIIAAKTAGTITECPVATWCRDLGASWYLPAGGEMLMIINNKADVDACRDLLGLTKISTLSYIWTSTQCGDGRAWYFFRNDSRLYTNLKTTNGSVVAVSALS